MNSFRETKNIIFTKEKYEQADKYQQEVTKRISGNPFADPLYYKSALDKAGFYFEGGVRKFSDFTKKMIDEFGENIKPYLIKLWADVQKEKPKIIEPTPTTPVLKQTITEEKKKIRFKWIKTFFKNFWVDVKKVRQLKPDEVYFFLKKNFLKILILIIILLIALKLNAFGCHKSSGYSGYSGYGNYSR